MGFEGEMEIWGREGKMGKEGGWERKEIRMGGEEG